MNGEFPWNEVRIESRLGSGARIVRLGALVHAEVEDSPEFGAWDRMIAPPGGMHLVRAWERHRGAVLASVAGLVLLVVAFLKLGAPAMARSVAFKLPDEVLHSVSDETLRTLDRLVLKPSALSEERRREVREHLRAAAEKVGGMPPYRIEFRRMGAPNAFALPSGTIIFTDEMVEFAGSNDELAAVFGHELGHVRHRHGVRLVLQHTAVALAVGFFLGDVSSTFSAFGALPVTLLENGYSRGFEEEADEFAMFFSGRARIGPEPYAELFERIRRKYPDTLPVWFSSHPDTAERIRRARAENVGEMPAP